MEIKIVLLINLLAYSFIVSQSFIYIIALYNVQPGMDASSYIVFRKLLDKNFRQKFRIPFYVTLTSNTVLTILCSMAPDNLLFITSAVALLAFFTDAFFMLSANMPVNTIINTWSAENFPDNRADYRTRWLTAFKKRQVVNITGFLSLLIGVVFG